MFRPMFVVIAVAGTLSACFEAPATPDAARKQIVKVIAEPLRFEFARTRVEAVGTSRAMQSVDIYPVTAGEVVAVNFEPGQWVEAGQVLVELDSREEALGVRMARLQLEDAERLYDRYQRSADSGAVTPTVLDAARTAAESARLDVERAEIALADRRIRAAFDGFVGTTETERGDRVNPATMITTLDDRQALLVSFEVPEAFIGEISVGNYVDLETWNSRASVVSGEIVDISSRIDPQTRTFVARARVANADDALRPGMSFRVAAEVTGELFPVVAETGVQWGSDGAFVWSIENDQATRIPVKVVQRRAGRVLIDAELQNGDIVVVEGIQRMRNGIEVNYDTLTAAHRDADAIAIQMLRDDSDVIAGSD